MQFTQLTLGSASPRFGPVRVMLGFDRSEGSNEGNVLVMYHRLGGCPGTKEQCIVSIIYVYNIYNYIHHIAI